MAQNNKWLHDINDAASIDEIESLYEGLIPSFQSDRRLGNLSRMVTESADTPQEDILPASKNIVEKAEGLDEIEKLFASLFSGVRQINEEIRYVTSAIMESDNETEDSLPELDTLETPEKTETVRAVRNDANLGSMSLSRMDNFIGGCYA